MKFAPLRPLRTSVACLSALLLGACLSPVDTGDESGERTNANEENVKGATSQCAQNKVEGVDVAHGNGAVTWSSVEGSGRGFAFLKATQGTYNQQTGFQQSWSDAKAAGLLRGAYHFFDPTEDGAAQAQNFLSELGGDLGELPPALDLECPNGDAKCLGPRGAGKAPGSAIRARVKAFLDAVEQATGRKPIIYTFPSYLQSAGVDSTGFDAYPLWVASLKSCATVPPPWKSATFWQYSWTGSVSGISGNVDEDRFFGTQADLDAFAAGGMQNPPPPPPPNDCKPLTFPSGVTLNTVPDDALSTQYQKIGSACGAPACFLDTQNLVSPDGTKHDVHVSVGAHFELWELVQNEIDPNGTGKPDPAQAYSTKVLVTPALVAGLDKLRAAFGGPVDISDGYRSPAHQAAHCTALCGGAECTDKNGQACSADDPHSFGTAADLATKYQKAAAKAGFSKVSNEDWPSGTELHVETTCQ